MLAPKKSVLLGVLVGICQLPPAMAQAELAKTFIAVPGTNTLMTARNAVRSWHANGHADEVAVIVLREGDYALTEPLILDGRDGNANWLARTPDKTLITGGKHITGLAATPDGHWHAAPELHFEQLFINGERAARSRFPAKDRLPLGDLQVKELPAKRAQISVKVPAEIITALTADPIALAEHQILVFHKWDTSRYALSAFDPTNGTITVEGQPMTSWNPWNAQSFYLLDNCTGPSLAPGAWFLGPAGELNYHPLPGETLGRTEAVAPVLEQLLIVHGASNLHFRGLHFGYTGYRLPREGCPPVQAAAGIGASIQIDDAENLTFDNCEITHTGNYGIWLRSGCRHCRIEHCLLEDLGAGGIRIGEMGISQNPANLTGANVIANNIIRGCGRIHPSAVGIWIGQSANNEVTHNDISDTFYTGISAGWTWGYGPSQATNNDIGYNRIHQIGQGVLSDMGGIYTLGVSPGSTCAGNVIYDVRAHDYGGWGIYPDEGSSGWQIASNLVWRCTSVLSPSGGGFHQHYGASNNIVNNVFALSSGPPMQATRVENHLSFTLEHNLIISSNSAFFYGPWNKLQYASGSNCFVAYGQAMPLFPKGNLAAWQQAGHEPGSILTDLDLKGNWPDITIPPGSPILATGFNPFDPQLAGVTGDRAWKHRARESKGSSRREEALNK